MTSARSDAARRTELVADHESLRQIGQWLETVAGEPVPTTVELAVHEVACNVVDHAKPPSGVFGLSGERRGSKLHVAITDDGQPYGGDAKVAEPGTLQERGFGLFIVEAVALDVTYQHHGGLNHWSLLFELDSQSPQGGGTETDVMT